MLIPFNQGTDPSGTPFETRVVPCNRELTHARQARGTQPDDVERKNFAALVMPISAKDRGTG